MQNWKKICSRRSYDGFRKIDTVKYELPSAEVCDFDIKVEPHAAAIVALTQDCQIILVSQFRPGPQKVIAEIVGGVIESGEEPSTAARRELIEETGYDGELIELMNYNACAYSTQRKYCYVALNCERVSRQNLDNTEFIEIKFLSIVDFENLVLVGDMTDTACGFAALRYFRTHNILKESGE